MPARLIDVHLGCPLGLGNHTVEATQAESAHNVHELLKRGGVYYGHDYLRKPAPWNFTAVMFPITPQQIGPGYVLGEERIHTTVSGRFAFIDGAAAEVYVVDGRVTVLAPRASPRRLRAAAARSSATRSQPSPLVG